MPGDVRQSDRRIVPHPPVPVAATDARGEHAQDDPVRRAHGIVDVRNNERLLEGAHHGGAHRPIVATVDPLSLPPDELRALGHHVWDRLVDRWEELDAQPPIAPIDPDFGRHSIAPCPDPATDARQAIDELFDDILTARPARRPPALLRPHRQPEQPDQRARRPDRHRPQRVRGKLDRRRGRVRAGAGRRSTGSGDGWACPTAPRASSSAAARSARSRRSPPPRTTARDDRDQATGYVSEHTHAAVAKAWRILGFNPANLRVLKADPGLPAPAVAAIEAAIHLDREAGLRPFLLVGTAGTTSTGSVDPLHDLAELAAARGPVVPRRRRLRRARPPHADRQGPPHRHRARRQPRAGPAQVALPAVRDRRRADPAQPGCSSTRSRSTAPTCATATRGKVELREFGPQLTRSAARAEALAVAARLRPRRVQAGDRAHDRAGRVRRGRAQAARRLGGRLARDAGRRLLPSRGHSDDADRRAGACGGRRRLRRARAPRSSTAARVARLCTINPRTTEADIAKTIDRLEHLAR